MVRPDKIETSQGFESAHQQVHGFQRQELKVGCMAFPLRCLDPPRYPTLMSTTRGGIPEGRVRLANQSARLTHLRVLQVLHSCGVYRRRFDIGRERGEFLLIGYA